MIREAAARARILGMTPCKWCLVRALEAVARLFLLRVPPSLNSKGSQAKPNTILVIEYWNLGDLAILVPFLTNLRRSFPTARISLLVNSALASFLKGQGLVDEFIPVRVPWARHFNRLRKYNPFSLDWISLTRAVLALRERRFDWAFSGRMDIRDNLILWLSGARRRIGYGVGGGGFLLTDRVLPDLSRPHRADLWLHLLEAVDQQPDRGLGNLRLTDSELARAQSFLVSRGVPSGRLLIRI